MGCASSTGLDVSHEEVAAHQAIEQQIIKDKEATKNVMRMLLLGTGESGKSTIMKQFNIAYGKGFSLTERETYREIIYVNTIQSAQAVLEALALLQLSLNSRHFNAANLIQELDPEVDPPNIIIKDALVALWSDPAVKSAMTMQNRFQLNNSAQYFFEQLERIFQDGWVPNDDDIVRARIRTTGIIDASFTIGKLLYKIYDVGGQRSERRKWIQVFQDVQVLLFLVSISEYDEVLFEDETVSRMTESMTVFENISNSLWFRKTTTILMLNKIDLLLLKLPKSSLKAAFPRYQGDDTNFEQACQFFWTEFRALYKQDKPLYHHFTCATDSTSTKAVLTAVNDNIIRTMLAVSGIL